MFRVGSSQLAAGSTTRNLRVSYKAWNFFRVYLLPSSVFVTLVSYLRSHKYTNNGHHCPEPPFPTLKHVSKETRLRTVNKRRKYRCWGRHKCQQVEQNSCPRTSLHKYHTLLGSCEVSQDPVLMFSAFNFELVRVSRPDAVFTALRDTASWWYFQQN